MLKSDFVPSHRMPAHCQAIGLYADNRDDPHSLSLLTCHEARQSDRQVDFSDRQIITAPISDCLDHGREI